VSYIDGRYQLPGGSSLGSWVVSSMLPGLISLGRPAT
jgi:hypothetical protein